MKHYCQKRLIAALLCICMLFTGMAGIGTACAESVVAITKQPVSVTVAEGASAKVTVTATGDDLTYMWFYKNAGAASFTRSTNFTDNYYDVTMTASRAGRQVYCVVMDAYGNTAKTNTVTLNMSGNVAITGQPQNVSVASGATAKVTVTATGDDLTYMWFYKNADASSFTKSTTCTGNTYSTTMNATRAGRQVYCVVMDAYGNTAKSNTVTLSMSASAVAITKQPVGVSVVSGAAVNVSFTATGDGLTYTWYYKNAGDSSFTESTTCTGNTYSTTMTSARAGRQIYCVVTDKYGNTAKTNTVTLNMLKPATITKQPVGVTVAAGKTAKVAFTATGDGLTYTWYYKNAGDSSFTESTTGTGNTYSTIMNTTRAGRQVYCVVTDKYGNTAKTNTVTLNMLKTATITKQPTSVTVAEGKTANVTFTATGDGLTYAWYYKNAGASSFTKSTTGTGNTYSTTMTSARAGRQVYCVVTDKYGNTAKTNTVTLNMQKTAKITKQPVSVSAAEGKTAKVTFTATGDGLTYAWYYKNADDSSFTESTTCTGNTYSATMNATRTGRQVYCVVTDKYGNTAKTNTVTLSMENAASDFEYKVSSGKVYITGYTGSATTVVIPAYIEGYPVTVIDDNAFYKNSYIKSVTFPSTVTTIDYKAFQNCGALNTVIIPGNVTTIAQYAFKNCDALKNLTISKGVKTIDSYAFEDCDALQTVSIPGTVTTIGYSSFNNCSALSSLTISSGVGSIGGSAFEQCDALQTVSIPGSVSTIGDGAFSGCDALKTLTIKSGVTKIGYKAFNDCSALGSVTVPSTVKTIGNYAFKNCDALKTVTLEKGIQTIGSYAFYDSDALASISVPGSVTSIGSDSFSGCDALKTVSITKGSDVSIEPSAFFGCKAMTSLTLPSSVVKIGGYAFEDCDALTSVSIPGSVTTMGYEAFYSCDNLAKVTIGEGVTYIGEKVFLNCSKLASVSLPSTLLRIDYGAFENTALTSLSIPSSVISIAGNAFRNIDSLTSVTIPGSVTTLGSYAFHDCDALTSVKIKSGMTKIEGSAFENCSLLNSVSLPTSLTSIGGYAFRNCDALVSVTVPEGVTSIGDNCFYSCSNLTTVKLPGSLVSIGSNVFKDSTNVTVSVVNGSYAHDWCITKGVRYTTR